MALLDIQFMIFVPILELSPCRSHPPLLPGSPHRHGSPPPACLAPHSSSPASRSAALPFPQNRLAKQGLSRHAALTLTGAAPGKEGADIPALPVKAEFQRLCLGVGKNKEGLSVHVQNPTLLPQLPGCRSGPEYMSPPAPPH